MKIRRISASAIRNSGAGSAAIRFFEPSQLHVRRRTVTLPL
jgi:hypothetical protein